VIGKGFETCPCMNLAGASVPAGSECGKINASNEHLFSEAKTYLEWYVFENL
jgi:hypothetical protein